PQGIQTVPQGPHQAQTEPEVRRDYVRYRQIGHSGSLQPASRLDRDVVADDGTVYRKGTAVPQRADFNTLDNPFFWTADQAGDAYSSEPEAGVHFVIFMPMSDELRRTRLEMDGIMPGCARILYETGSAGRGFNKHLKTTPRHIVPV